MYHQPYLEVIETVLNFDLPEPAEVEAIHQHVLHNTRSSDEDTWQPFEARSFTFSHSL